MPFFICPNCGNRELVRRADRGLLARPKACTKCGFGVPLRAARRLLPGARRGLLHLRPGGPAARRRPQRLRAHRPQGRAGHRPAGPRGARPRVDRRGRRRRDRRHRRATASPIRSRRRSSGACARSASGWRVNAEGDLPAEAVADLFPAYDDDGGPAARADARSRLRPPRRRELADDRRRRNLIILGARPRPARRRSLVVIIDQAHGARPRPARRHRARLPGPRRPRRPRGHAARTSTARSRSSASASTRSASPSPRSRASARTRSRSACPDVSGRRARDRPDRDHGAALPLRLRAQRHPAEPGRSRTRAERALQPADRRGQARVEAASRSASRTTARPTARRYYLFDKNTLELLAGPVAEEAGPLPRTSRRQAAGRHARSSTVPQGTVVVQEDAAATTRPATSTSQPAPPSTSCSATARRCPATRSRTRSANFDPTHQPAERHLRLHRRGPRAFQDGHPRRSPQRGALPRRRRPPAIAARRRPTSSRAASRSCSTTRSSSRPIINFVENPDGIDGRTGAQISGSFTHPGGAATSPRSLKIGALPIKLTLISQSTVSATLGQQALDQGLKAALVGLDPRPALPARLLPLPRAGRRRSG